MKPAWMRAEYANLVPLALADGTFECLPELVWAQVYSFNRREVKVADVTAILEEFSRCGMLFRWLDIDTGKYWGFWVGIDQDGRLPAKSLIEGKRVKVGKTPPIELLRQYQDSSKQGLGLVGGGIGGGGKEQKSPSTSQSQLPEEIEFQGKYLRISASDHAALIAGNPEFTPEEVRACYRQQDLWQIGHPARRKKNHFSAMTRWLANELRYRAERKANGRTGSPQQSTDARKERADQRHERTQQSIETVLGHRSGLADALRQNVPK